MKVQYYNPKTGRYMSVQVLSINGDIIECLNKKYDYRYKESLKRLKELTLADNPDWHGLERKPLIKLIGFK